MMGRTGLHMLKPVLVTAVVVGGITAYSVIEETFFLLRLHFTVTDLWRRRGRGGEHLLVIVVFGQIDKTWGRTTRATLGPSGPRGGPIGASAPTP